MTVEMAPSVPALPQECHHFLLFVQLTEKRQALLTLSFVKVLHESRGPHFEESPTRSQIGRGSQNCQHFLTQTVISFLRSHSSDSTPAQLLVIAVYYSCLVLVVFWRGSLPSKSNPINRGAP
jgi:hypothetical protein